MSDATKSAVHPLGVVQILAAAVVWAVGYLLRKSALDEVSSISISFLNAVIVTGFFIAAFRLEASTLWSTFARHPLHYGGLALFGVALGSTCMIAALGRLDLGVAVLLEKLQPLFTLPLAWIFLGERTPRRAYPAVVAAVVFSYLVSCPEPLQGSWRGADPLGVALVVAAALSWAGAGIIGRSIMQLERDASTVVVIRFAIGALLLSPLAMRDLYVHGLPTTAAPWVALVTASVLSTGVGYILYYRGLRTVQAGTASFLELLSPVVAVLLGASILGERFTFTQLVASAGLLTSVYLVATAKAGD